MAQARTLNLPGFLVHTGCTSEKLALVELLSRTLLADHLLVARHEPGKESSVSVCHNSEFDLVNNRSRTQDVPRSFDYLLPHAML